MLLLLLRAVPRGGGHLPADLTGGDPSAGWGGQRREENDPVAEVVAPARHLGEPGTACRSIPDRRVTCRDDLLKLFCSPGDALAREDAAVRATWRADAGGPGPAGPKSRWEGPSLKREPSWRQAPENGPPASWAGRNH